MGEGKKDHCFYTPWFVFVSLPARDVMSLAWARQSEIQNSCTINNPCEFFHPFNALLSDCGSSDYLGLISGRARPELGKSQVVYIPTAFLLELTVCSPFLPSFLPSLWSAFFLCMCKGACVKIVILIPFSH